MYSVTKEFQFDAGHRLTLHAGKCWNLHGHRYKVVVTFSCHNLNSNQMVVDFGDLRPIKQWLDDKWDHGLVLNSKDEKTVAFVRSMGFKLYTLDAEPTAENMAAFLFGKIKVLCPDVAAFLTKVVVFETPTCSGEFSFEK